MSTPPIIAGLYPYVRDGVHHRPKFTLREIPQCLELNPWYRDELLVLAGDANSARQLEGFGLDVHRVFDDAPELVQRDMAHKMKHWMCLWAAREFGEFLWVDWDTVCLRRPDEAFWEWCGFAGTPKFVRIPEYWATVNCGVYYGCEAWADFMEKSLEADVSEPNDELLWTTVLSDDVRERPEFWWDSRVVHVQTRDDFRAVRDETYFVHVGDLGWASELKESLHAQLVRG